MPGIRANLDIRPISEFRANAAAFVQQVRESRRPLVLTQRGRGAAVLLDIEEYARLMDRLELLEDIATAEDQIAGGRGVAHDDARAQVLDRIR
jgi:antitoxin YefM